MKFLIFFLIPILSFGAAPTDALKTKMSQLLENLNTQKGWTEFKKKYETQFDKVTQINKGPQVEVIDITFDVDGAQWEAGLVLHSLFINAPSKIVTTVVNSPKLFQNLFDLDRSSDPGPHDSLNYEANIFKKIPGLFTQDYTLRYVAKKDGTTWIQRVSQVKDTQDFALRDNAKVIEEVGPDSIYREVSLFLPLKWWLRTRLLKSTLRKITKSEVALTGRVIQCVSENAKEESKVTPELALECHKKSK